MNNYTLRFLHYVFAASDYGSFHRAAQALGIQTSAISRRVHEIEVLLGFDIFRRSHNGVQLTSQGQEWIAEARPHYDALRETTARASFSAGKNAILNIGVGTSLGKGEIVALLRGRNKTQTLIAVTLTDGPCAIHRSRVLCRQLDLAFIWEFCSHEGCRSKTLWQDRLFVCLPEGHELLSSEHLSWADLRGERLLVPQGKNGPLFDPCLLGRIGNAGFGPVIEYCDAAQVTVLTEIMLGLGITVTGHGLAGSQLPGVAWRPLSGENSTISVKAIWLESNAKPALHRLLARAESAIRN